MHDSNLSGLKFKYKLKLELFFVVEQAHLLVFCVHLFDCKKCILQELSLLYLPLIMFQDIILILLIPNNLYTCYLHTYFDKL